MEMNIVLKLASERDSAFVYKVKKKAFRNYVEKTWGWDEKFQKELHQKRFSRLVFELIVVDNKKVGYLSVNRENNAIKINQLFILPEYQGLGIGRKVLSQLINEAELGAKVIDLRVLKINPRAKSFYEREGFKKIGESDTHDLMQRSYSKSM